MTDHTLPPKPETPEAWAAAFAESEVALRGLLEISPSPMAISRLADGRYLLVNQPFCELTGYASEELTGQAGMDIDSILCDPAGRKRLIAMLDQDSGPAEVGCRMAPKGGTPFSCRMRMKAIRFQGRACLLSAVLPTAPPPDTRQALQPDEHRFRNILNSITETYYETDLDGRFTFFNRSATPLFGYTADELIGMSYKEYTSPEDGRRLFKAFHEVYQGAKAVKVFEYSIRCKDGSIRQVETSAGLLRDGGGKPIGFYGILRDRTDQKKAEEALRRSEERFHDILKTMEEGYYEVDTAGRLTFFNQATLNAHGYPADELMGMSYKAYLDPETIREIRQVYGQMYQTGLPAKVMQYDIIRRDGTRRTIETSAYPLKSGDNRIIGFWGISRDRTEQKQAETALQKSEEMYRLLVENANDGIYITQGGRIRFHNPKVLTITGHDDAELAGMRFADLIHPEDRAGVYGAHQRKMAAGKTPDVISFRLLNKAQETVWVELNAIGIVWEGRPAALNFLRDVTPQKRIEAQLLQASKMEAVGTLAGGIAHDFNNLLMGIKGSVTLALMDLEPDHPLHERLSAIDQHVQAGTDLTRQLLGTARGGKYETRPTDLNQLVARSADLFSRTKREIRIHKAFADDLWTVEVDRGQIEQVLLNLYVNAWQAMTGGGDLFLETRNVRLDAYYVKPYDVPPGRYAKVTVTDCGVGIDPRNLKRIFDPFFTTKSMGMGTGLGLSSAYGIIANHGGIITVYSEVGSGTTFNIYLPVSGKKVADSDDPHTDIVKGHETILFVDDEKSIVEVGRMMLERLGYTVLVAHGGEEAVAIYRAQQDRIDLVMMDMIMPGMSGSSAFSAIRGINPRAKVLLSSGYSLNGQAQHILDQGCNGFIQKPFSVQTLSVKLREVLKD